jgi:hypothetical protein
MPQELFEVLAQARSLDELSLVKPMAQDVRENCIRELEDADARKLAIHRKLSRGLSETMAY